MVEGELVLGGDEHGVVAHLPLEHVGALTAVTVERARPALIGRFPVVVAARPRGKVWRERGMKTMLSTPLKRVHSRGCVGCVPGTLAQAVVVVVGGHGDGEEGVAGENDAGAGEDAPVIDRHLVEVLLVVDRQSAVDRTHQHVACPPTTAPPPMQSNQMMRVRFVVSVAKDVSGRRWGESRRTGDGEGGEGGVGHGLNAIVDGSLEVVVAEVDAVDLLQVGVELFGNLSCVHVSCMRVVCGVRVRV